MPRYITPRRPFVLTGPLHGTELTRPPERTVPMERTAAAVSTVIWTVLLTLITGSIITLVNALRLSNKEWRTWLEWGEPWMLLVYLAPAALYAWRWGRIKAAWHFSGYHLADEEMYSRSGLMFRDMTSLAYARIQSVDVESGPIQRKFDLASLYVRTAGGSVRIDNLDPIVASDLRDKLTELARIERFPV